MDLGSKYEEAIKLRALLVHNNAPHASPLGFILGETIGRIIWCELLNHSKVGVYLHGTHFILRRSTDAPYARL